MATRYGVFLRPDPLTCAAVTRITWQLRAQFGLVSAGAFPPHATLAGSLPLAGPPEELLRALAPVASFTVRNHGLAWLNGGLVYDVHGPEMAQLAATVDAVVRPLLEPAPGLAADLFEPDRWYAHLSLGSHDLAARPDLHDEVEDYVRGLARRGAGGVPRRGRRGLPARARDLDRCVVAGDGVGARAQPAARFALDIRGDARPVRPPRLRPGA